MILKSTLSQLYEFTKYTKYTNYMGVPYLEADCNSVIRWLVRWFLLIGWTEKIGFCSVKCLEVKLHLAAHGLTSLGTDPYQKSV